MKKSFSSVHECIHRWAQQEQHEGYSSNVYFEGTRVYSYGRHYLLGEFVKNKRGTLGVIIDDRGYSNTTSKHISIAWSAVSHIPFRFSRPDTDPVSVKNFLESQMEKLRNARKPELYVSAANAKFERYVAWCEWWGHPYKSKEGYKEAKKMIDVINSGESDRYLAMGAKRAAAAKRKDEKAYAERQKKVADDFTYTLYPEWLKKWEAHEPGYYSRPSAPSILDGLVREHLRISLDGKHVETTLGLKVSSVEAAIMYQRIKAGENVVGQKIDGYTIISKNGTLKVGCHIFEMSHVNEIGEQLLNDERIVRAMRQAQATAE